MTGKFFVINVPAKLNEQRSIIDKTRNKPTWQKLGDQMINYNALINGKLIGILAVRFS